VLAIPAVLQELLRLPGATYCCAVEQDSGQLLGEAGRDRGAADEVLPWGRTAAGFLAADGDDLDDVMMTSRRAYHLVRRLDGHPSPLLVYLCLDRSRANLALSRRELALVQPLVPGAARPAPPPVNPQLEAVTPGAVVEPAVLPRRVAARVPPPPAAMPARTRVAGVPLVPAPRAGARTVDRPPRAADGEAPVDRGQLVAPRWADDVGTMRRLLAGLRALR
jgi:hypothetical protein